MTNPTELGPVVIVGGGHAGIELAFELRKLDDVCSITVLGSDPALPYHRPTLSKQFLMSTADDPQPLRAASAYAEKNITLRTATRVAHIDRAAQQVRLETGEVVAYGCLVLATGGTPRTLALPGLPASVPNLGTLRTLADATALRGQLRAGATLAIIGAGYIGLEVAAAARALDVEVHVFEQQPRLLSRVASPALATFLASAHARAGVALHTDTVLTSARCRDDGCLAHLDFEHTANGHGNLEVDAVLVGIGIVPDTGLAQDCGLAVDDGIVVDDHFRTSDPHIRALGDCARQHHAFYAQSMRIESIPNALEQARALAGVLTGHAPRAHTPPWFWSDQYKLKIQTVGLPHGSDATVQRGTAEDGSFALFHLREGIVVAVEAVNRAKDFLAGKQLVAARAQPAAAMLEDPGVDLAKMR